MDILRRWYARECWFCGHWTKKSTAKRPVRHAWQCRHCDSLNGFRSDGSYRFDVLDASPHRSTSGLNENSENRESAHPVLCDECTQKQKRIVDGVAKGLSQRRMERKYPLCGDCCVAVERTLRRGDLILQGLLLPNTELRRPSRVRSFLSLLMHAGLLLLSLLSLAWSLGVLHFHCAAVSLDDSVYALWSGASVTSSEQLRHFAWHLQWSASLPQTPSFAAPSLTWPVTWSIVSLSRHLCRAVSLVGDAVTALVDSSVSRDVVDLHSWVSAATDGDSSHAMTVSLVILAISLLLPLFHIRNLRHVLLVDTVRVVVATALVLPLASEHSLLAPLFLPVRYAGGSQQGRDFNGLAGNTRTGGAFDMPGLFGANENTSASFKGANYLNRNTHEGAFNTSNTRDVFCFHERRSLDMMRDDTDDEILPDDEVVTDGRPPVYPVSPRSRTHQRLDMRPSRGRRSPSPVRCVPGSPRRFRAAAAPTASLSATPTPPSWSLSQVVPSHVLVAAVPLLLVGLQKTVADAVVLVAAALLLLSSVKHVQRHAELLRRFIRLHSHESWQWQHTWLLLQRGPSLCALFSGIVTGYYACQQVPVRLLVAVWDSTETSHLVLVTALGVALVLQTQCRALERQKRMRRHLRHRSPPRQLR
ncbi:MAG: hypothetical protein MHM6MM_001837 [Cercozoa sp. M6MM]